MLPRDSHTSFRLALGLGTAAVIVLAVLRLFPVALIAAALLLPTLVVLYLVDVNVYEDEPIWVMGLTIGWGAVAGVGFGLIALAVEPSVGSVIVNGTSQYLVVQGLVLPFCGFFVLLVGPLILLRYQRFNDVLDGVAFGATAAAWFSGAQAITYGVHLIGAGLRPGGAVLPWIWRLLSLAVGMPVLTMGAAAAACAALWLRYRAPARDADALGALGHPAVALPLAGLLVMGGAVGETFLPAGGWLAWLAAFDVVAISLLRRAIHVGLLEESSETPDRRRVHLPQLRPSDRAPHVLRPLRHLAPGAAEASGPRRSPSAARPVPRSRTLTGDRVVSVFAERHASRVSTGSLGGRILHVFLLVFLLLIGFSILTTVLVAPGHDRALFQRSAVRGTAERPAGHPGDRVAQLAVRLQPRLPRVGGEGLAAGARQAGPDDQRRRTQRHCGDPGVPGGNRAVAGHRRAGQRAQGALAAGAGRQPRPSAARGGRRLPLGRGQGVRRRPHLAAGKSAGQRRVRGGVQWPRHGDAQRWWARPARAAPAAICTPWLT